MESLFALYLIVKSIVLYNDVQFFKEFVEPTVVVEEIEI